MDDNDHAHILMKSHNSESNSPFQPNLVTCIIVSFSFYSVKMGEIFTENPLIIIVYLYVKNGLTRVNIFLIHHISNVQIFELPADFIPHILINLN